MCVYTKLHTYKPAIVWWHTGDGVDLETGKHTVTTTCSVDVSPKTMSVTLLPLYKPLMPL